MAKPSRILLMVEDSPEDRDLYRRCLANDPEYDYTFVETSLGAEGLSLCQQHQPDAILLDYRLPDMDGLEFLTRLRSQAYWPSSSIIVVTGQGSEEIAVKALKTGAEDYLVKEQITPAGLRWAISQTIETVQLRLKVQQGIERERIVSQIIHEVHQTLDLDEILQTTVTTVRDYLQTDRILIFQLQPDGQGRVIHESVGAEWTPLLATTYYDPCFDRDYVIPFLNGQITHKSDIYDGSIQPCHVELLASLEVRANLVVPIQQDHQLWGLLIAHHCRSTREWCSFEIDFLKDLTKQLGIALKQAELFQQTQDELIKRRQIELEREQLLAREQTARQEAERANRMKDEFLAILSHELRSPLNPILGWARLLQTRQFDPARMATALATIERNAKLQTQLIDDLLDVSKILRGKLSMNPVPVYLPHVVEAAIDTVSAAALAKDIQIKPVLPTVGQVSGDPTRLQQIVWNLLSNAVKFTPSQGLIEICLEQVDAWTQIIVRDTGKGITPDFLPYLFYSFHQEDASTTRQYGGLGLGLAIVRYLVEAHGGTVWADSAGEGQGATFTVQLPSLEPAPLPSDDIAPISTDQSDLTGIRVLAVDDESDSREILTAMLTICGAEVLTIASAEAVLDNLASFRPDVLISDIGMPEVDGYALIQQIRSLSPEAGGQIPAIAMTAYARSEDRKRALTSGFQEHISKPVELALLTAAIRKLIQPEYGAP